MLCRGLRFGQARPRQLGIGEHDRRNRPRRERDVLARHHFDGDAAFMRRLVREHRLADHVADGEDRRLVRAALLVDHDEAALIDLHLRLLEAGDLRVRAASHGDEDAIEDLDVAPRVAFKGDANAGAFRLHLRDLRVEQHALHRLRDALGEDVHEIAIGARQQPGRHLDDGHRAAERGVDGAELEADVAAADDEERCRGVRQIERGGGIHHARVVKLQHRRNRRHRSGRDDGVLELNLILFTVGELHLQTMRVDDLGQALQVLHLAKLDELSRAARQPLDDVVLEVAQLREIDPRLAELDTPRLRVARLVNQVRDVQQRFRRDASDVHADAAGVGIGIDERGGETEIGGEKRGGVAAGSGADNRDLDGDHVLSDRSSRTHETTKPRKPQKHESQSKVFFVVSWFRGFVFSWSRGRVTKSVEVGTIGGLYPWSANRNGCSSASATQRRKRMPSAPSITRWSYDSDSGSMKRGTKSTSSPLAGPRPRSARTGCQLAREIPRIATSGALTIGVKYVPPMAPRFEMLKQPPCISSSEIFLLRAFSESCASSTDNWTMFF